MAAGLVSSFSFNLSPLSPRSQENFRSYNNFQLFEYFHSFTHTQYPIIITMSESKEREAFEEGSNSSSSLLLPDPQDYGFEEDIHPKKKSRTWLRPLYIHILIMVFYTIVFFFMAKTLRGQNCHPDMIFCKSRNDSSISHSLTNASARTIST